jgi:colanic acid biosynthesis glycosyl transferase WcaI
MRILFLTQFFDPEPISRGLTFAKYLKNAGHEVEVITGFPNYPGGKIYPGYSLKYLQKEIIDGINVTRVPLYPSHDSSAIKRVLNYFSFAFTSCLYGLFFAKKADVMYVYHPPLTTGLSAAVISLFRCIPFVYDIQDMWPDTLRATGMINNKLVLKVIAGVCQWLYKRATHLVVLSPGFRDLLIDRKVPSHKIDVVYNWCEEHSLNNPQQLEINQFGMQGYFNVVFAGTMGKAQALDSVLNAAKIIAQSNQKIQFVFIGGGIELIRLQERVQKEAINNVKFLPRMPMNEIGAVLSAADVLLIHLKSDPLFKITIPMKMQAYLSVGKPILMAVSGNAADLIQKADAGYCVEPENVEAIADTVLKMAVLSPDKLLAMGERGSKFYKENLAFDIGASKLLSILDNTKK